MGGVGAGHIEKVSEKEAWFNDDHYMQKAYDWLDHFNMGEEDGLRKVEIVWGVDGVDRSGTDKLTLLFSFVFHGQELGFRAVDVHEVHKISRICVHLLSRKVTRARLFVFFEKTTWPSVISSPCFVKLFAQFSDGMLMIMGPLNGTILSI